MRLSMARAINQTIAWILAFVLSLIVFGIVLAIVMSTKSSHGGKDKILHSSEHNKHSDNSEHSDAHGGGAEEPNAHPTDPHAPQHPADAEVPAGKHESAVNHGEKQEPHDSSNHAEGDVEMTPASVKAQTQPHSSEGETHKTAPAPHH